MSSENRVKCPCCSYLTLSEWAAYEICSVCGWEDDGQSDSNADEVMGGPNKSYSLSEARKNFKNYMTMYRETDTLHPTNPEYISLIKTLIEKYKEYAVCDIKPKVEGEVSLLEDKILQMPKSKPKIPG